MGWEDNKKMYLKEKCLLTNDRYSDEVILMGDDIRTKERNASVLLNSCKIIGLTV